LAACALVARPRRSGCRALVARSARRGVPVLRNARATSAGGVVHRSVDGRLEIVLVHRRQPVLWALPKGTPDAGETLEETALRETREETGLEVELETPISAIRYFFVHASTRFHKTVHFYLMRPVGGALDRHDHEFDEVRWLQVEEALELMSYATERGVVEEAVRMLHDGAVQPGGAAPDAQPDESQRVPRRQADAQVGA
jgi:8-oxo-dGTP pyrophosphatase MutT (NUDIX family)